MKWLSVDPGHSTGWALWQDDDLLEAGTDDGWEFVDELSFHLRVDVTQGPTEHPGDRFSGVQKLVMEDWVLYPWAAEALIWDQQRTVRIIGALELTARLYDIELVHQPAKIKEAAEQGGAENLFLRPLHPNRHANDAIRHGVYHLQTTKYGASAP